MAIEERDFNFSKTINLTHIEGPYDIHIVQTNNEEVNVYDHGKYLYSTKIPKVDVKYVKNARELKKARERQIIRDAKKHITWYHREDWLWVVIQKINGEIFTEREKLK